MVFLIKKTNINTQILLVCFKNRFKNCGNIGKFDNKCKLSNKLARFSKILTNINSIFFKLNVFGL